ncbi:MAG: ABC transporter ATP-binding protein [Desulfurococcaceae archaeon]|nr:ABC transporter ATP-binding protein [Desulfurococcaceae archaeon]
MRVNSILELQRVTAGYKSIKGFKSLIKRVEIVLRDISFTVEKGERVAIIGESGSGKTTILRVILGLLKPISGKVLIYGKDLYSLPSDQKLQILRRIGYVPQDPYRSLNPVLKIKYIVGEPLEAAGVEWRYIEERASEVLKIVGLPQSILNDTAEELSGGMRQRVLIARAIIAEPEILVLDEPTSALDVSIQAQIINLLNSIYDTFKVTMITVTHDLGVAQYLADRLIILKSGKIVEEGSVDEVLRNPKSEYTKSLITSYLQITGINSLNNIKIRG